MSRYKGDIEVWQRLKSGDRNAFELIYRNEIQNLIAYGRRYSYELELIEDCVHDLFVYIWNRRSNLSDTDSIRKYLLVALRHRIFTALKKNKSQELNESDSFQEERSIEDNIVQNETKEENALLILNSLQGLSARQREAIYLRYMNEMSYEDICEIMKINYQSVRNLISSGLKKLNTIVKK